MFDIRIGRESLHGSGALNGEALHGSGALSGETLDGRCPLQHVGLGDAGSGGRLTAGDSPARCQVLPPASPACYLQLGSEHLPKKEAASTGLAVGVLFLCGTLCSCDGVARTARTDMHLCSRPLSLCVVLSCKAILHALLDSSEDDGVARPTAACLHRWNAQDTHVYLTYSLCVFSLE